jgi:IS1 family transposase/transposase-like protein
MYFYWLVEAARPPPSISEILFANSKRLLYYNYMERHTATSMECQFCGSSARYLGKNRGGTIRYQCRSCKKTFTENPTPVFHTEEYLNEERGRLAIQLLVEGASVRTAERITGLHRDAILKLLEVAGKRSESLMTRLIRNVRATDVQADEIWGYVYKKEGHKRPEEYEDETMGDAYCWVAFERHTKLVLAWTLGKRTLRHAFELMFKLRRATTLDKFQLTTDGLRAYLPAVDEMLGDRVDFAQLIKVYTQPEQVETRYSPAQIAEAIPVIISGNPDPAKICTSHVERNNLTMRMQIRRLTRLTNGFSKKWENLRYALALHFAYYNFCRIHGSLRVTPAMEAGITDRVWTLTELLG